MNSKNCLHAMFRKPKSERGVALVISLILLTVMSLVGITAVRAISKEERMVGQTLDRSLAFQATESALREAEAWIEASGRPTLAPGTACSDQGLGSPQLRLCGVLVTATVPRWIDSSFPSSSTGWKNATDVGTGSFKITPQYFVEYLGDGFPCKLNDAASSGCKRYRVSARANPTDRASVVLQSIYATYEP
jgi:type IV pilus assembly protein PilX